MVLWRASFNRKIHMMISNEDEVTVKIINKEYVSKKMKAITILAKTMIFVGIVLFFTS